ncbi:hypothetical protein JK361_38330 [Streptomyces sp. 5-8]|uniref:PBS lyase n=1 Tax=Streptomyces musisoli TaxID=2802280 RepID=A0ABS1PD82_9ACTN|nr:hypothetical protein [Streptomyces musisoli]MBL1110346.1 hypothetical protein [Streptomyces musisoli]
MAGTSVEAVDAVDWSRFRTGMPEHHPVKEVPRALRRLVRRGPAATEEDCHPLYSCLFAPGGGLPSAAAAALPFLTALASDPANGARVALVELLGALNGAAREAGEQGTHGAWREEWRRQGDKITALLADREPSVRRAALLLADDDVLLERWHAETEPAVRLPLLLALGTRAATTADAPGTGDQHHRPAAHLPGHRRSLGAFVGELPGHPLKDAFGDGEFVPLGPHSRQLFDQLLFEFVQFRTPRGDPFQQLGIQHAPDRRRLPDYGEQNRTLKLPTSADDRLFRGQSLRMSLLVGPVMRQTLSFGRGLGIELGQRPVPVLDDVVLVINLSKTLGDGLQPGRAGRLHLFDQLQEHDTGAAV